VAGGTPGQGAAPTSNPSHTAEMGALKSPTRLMAPPHIGGQPQYPDSLYDYMPQHGNQASAANRSATASLANVVLSKEQRRSSNSRPGERGSILGRIGEALRSRPDEGERKHQMSVQITITTEQQDDMIMDDVKYMRGSESGAGSAPASERETEDVRNSSP